jgi:2-polyprenyl-3-methyl-5-hydroxy-6-metoxy-1,4-benzoquinol methylase
VVAENVQYKHSDYAVRSNDAYALTKYRIVLSWIPKTAGLRVLNAGCGSGEMTALLAQNPLWQIDAFDVDEEAIQLSQMLKAQLGLSNVNISKADIETFMGKDYDVVICNDVLEHLENPGIAVSKLVQMLKPGGTLCISVPALQWLFGYHDELLGHYRRYNRRTLSDLLSLHATVKRCRYFGFTLIPIAVWYSLFARKNYPVNKSMGNSLRARILYACLNLEQRVALPLGTSLLAFAVKSE